MPIRTLLASLVFDFTAIFVQKTVSKITLITKWMKIKANVLSGKTYQKLEN